MNYHILPNGNLKITADAEEQALLRNLRENPDALREHFTCSDLTWESAMCECEVLENLICNSDLEWIPEGSTGDLTSAPMLGITDAGENGEGYYKKDLPAIRFGEQLVAGDQGGARYSAIIARWAFTAWQVRPFLDDLADRGECTWEGGYAK